MPTARSAGAVTLAVLVVAGCNSDKPKYTPHAAPSGVSVNLPPVPNVPQKPLKAGDAYTVWGASYELRSRVHHQVVADKPLKITGYISKTNLADAPACAIHKTGKEDPEGCRPPIPTFWLCDTKDAARAHFTKQPEHAGRVGTARDQVPDEVNGVVGPGPDLVEQRPELRGAAVNVADEDGPSHAVKRAR